MNAALRAAVRTALEEGMEAVAIREGYRGLVEGGDAFRPMDWDAAGGIMHLGGTVIGTARCDEFRERRGTPPRRQNLVEHGIDKLIVMGGDGSLTAADLLHREWPGLISAARSEQGRIPHEAAERYSHLSLAGIGASIDNDMAGTDMSIGADTALHRIAEAVDGIGATAASHQRTFVVEVMGRHCGYLALMSGLATGADAVLIPEAPLARWLVDRDPPAAAARRSRGRASRQHRHRRRGCGRQRRSTDHRRTRPAGSRRTDGRGGSGHHPRPRPARRRTVGLRPPDGDPARPRRGSRSDGGRPGIDTPTGGRAAQPDYPASPRRVCRSHRRGLCGDHQQRRQRGPPTTGRQLLGQHRYPADPAAVTSESSKLGSAPAPPRRRLVGRTRAGHEHRHPRRSAARSRRGAPDARYSGRISRAD